MAMGNNPISNYDPDGEFFLLAALPLIRGTAVTAILDGLKTGFIDGGFDFTASRKSNIRGEAWADYDPTRRGTPTNRAWRIDKGMFQTDPRRTIARNILNIASRFTWERAQTSLGKTIAHARNLVGDVTNVEYFGGATIVNNNRSRNTESGMSLGSYIGIWGIQGTDFENEDLFRHEYGHTLQSHLMGPFYMTKVVPWSPLGIGLERLGIHDHMLEWYETNANILALTYFRNKNATALGATPWNFNDYRVTYRANLYWHLANPTYFFWMLFLEP